MAKDKQPKRTCLCGCGSTNSATKAAHKRAAERPILRQTLDLARTIARIRPGDQTPQPTSGPSRTVRSPRSHLPPATNPLDLMDTNEDGVPGSAEFLVVPLVDPLTLPDVLSRVWANRENRAERQDEDLFSRPPSPLLELSEPDNEQDPDGEVELSDLSAESEEEEPQTSVHLTATQRLNTQFELQAARAGMCDCYLGFSVLLTLRNSSKATGFR